MGEAALCGLLAGPNGAAKPAKRKGEEAVRRPHLLDSSHAPPPPSTSAPPQSPFAAPPPVASGSTTLVASGSGGFLSHPPLVAVESSNPNRKNIIESTARVAVTVGEEPREDYHAGQLEGRPQRHKRELQLQTRSSPRITGRCFWVLPAMILRAAPR
ncbi:uncharacterized protein LOC120653518 [Panicum virgatum]|uniref:uncharacterized protein LOC120653518 n=1 Tax=Panicum virgatum TaxID=38727 RepID=UPI0019D60F1A|nr:uncharacterized protein LOC120653518 [Panicum virgatum]